LFAKNIDDPVQFPPAREFDVKESSAHIAIQPARLECSAGRKFC
jgi:hypothetical protein